MPSLPAIQAVFASRHVMARNGRLVLASCRSQVAPASLVRKMRPSSPTIHPSWAVGKQAAKRFCRTSPSFTGSAPADAAQPITSAAMTNFMRTLLGVLARAVQTRRLYRTVSFGLYPPSGRSVNGVLRQAAPAAADRSEHVLDL